MLQKNMDPDQARGYKTFFMLNSTDYEISIPHENKNIEKWNALNLSDMVLIMLINEHEKSFITSGPD